RDPSWQRGRALRALTGVPSEPSALAVLEEANGFEVLVTNQGDDRIFVYGLAPPGPSGGPLPLPQVELPPLAAAPAVAPETTAPDEAPLAVVITLLGGTLPGSEPASGGAAPPRAGASPNEGAATTTTEATSEVVDLAGTDEEEDTTGPSDQQAPSPDAPVDPDIKEQLREIDLNRGTEKQNP